MVGSARKKYNIELPNLYETPDSNGKLKTPFNLFQRGIYALDGIALIII
jgi:hypothetical protein